MCSSARKKKINSVDRDIEKERLKARLPPETIKIEKFNSIYVKNDLNI